MDRYQDEIRRATAKGVRDLNLDKANGVARSVGFLTVYALTARPPGRWNIRSTKAFPPPVSS